jgi:hypothetical protein
LGKFLSLGANYDPGNWLLTAEWVRVVNYDARQVRVVRSAWNLAGAYRLGQWMPFASFSALKPLSATGAAPVSQKTVAGGLRWDFMRNADLKLQWDHVQLGDNSIGTLQSVQPGFPRGGSLNVLSLAFDFVY